MYIVKSSKFKKEVFTIQPGEFYISVKDEVICTLLGSCVAVCLHDHENKISGMNHFMLPGRISDADIFKDRSAKYGITAINTLISHILKAGAVKENLEAKIFGGGHITEASKGVLTIPFDNVRLAKILIEIEDIPIVEIDAGQDFTRKIFMEVHNGKVYLKKTNRTSVLQELAFKEKEYALRCVNNDQ
jgi:chemotaxis protein CheD